MNILLGPLEFGVFTGNILVAILLGSGLVYVMLRHDAPLPFIVDLCLGSLIGGVVLARLEYALLNPELFAQDPARLLQLQQIGGLGWHGAVVGGLLGARVVARWRKLNWPSVRFALAPALPLVGLAAWTACRSVGCVYGLEVDTLANYPPLLVTESRDIFGIVAPRYDTHTFGQVLSLTLLICVALGLLFDKRTFWPVLLIFSVGMLLIGFVRGDPAPVLAGWRADRWLDLALVLGCAFMIGLSNRKE